MMKTVVSITPLRVQEDSRTFKIAASFASFGYKSIVVEGKPSDLNKSSLPFKLISIGDVKNEGKLIGLRKRGVRLNIEVVSNSISNLNKESIMSTYDLLPEPLSYPVGCVLLLMYILYFMSFYFFRPIGYLPKASLYYIHGPNYFPAVYLLCKRYRAPFIYDAHDFYIGMEEKENLTPFERRWANPFLLRLEKSCIKHASAVVTVCDGVARLQEKVFRCHPVIARNCHDHRLDQFSRLNLRELLGLSAKDFLIVAIGAAKPGKAIEQSFDAIQRLPKHVHLAFVGKNTSQFINVIRQRGLEERVHLVPPVLPTEIVPFIQSADASIILYYSRSQNYENALPNGLFQAIAAELPLLYPELAEIDKIARYYRLGIPINPRDSESIASGILRLISDREQLLTYRRNGHVAREELSWEREENILRELVYKILE